MTSQLYERAMNALNSVRIGVLEASIERDREKLSRMGQPIDEGNREALIGIRTHGQLMDYCRQVDYKEALRLQNKIKEETYQLEKLRRG